MQAERTAPERKYVLSKVGSGDYLLPSNDGTTLWRFRTYEDGASYGLEHYDHDFTRWGVYRYAHRISVRHPGVVDTEDWDLWETVETDLPTRKAAINAALGYLDSEGDSDAR